MFHRNIFSDIKELIFLPSDDHLEIRDEHRNAIDTFLMKPDPDTAYNLFKFIKVLHQKESIFDLMNQLRLYEKGFLEMLPEHRDHYMHSASVYVLGLAIYNANQNIRDALTIDRHELSNRAQKTSFLFRWSLAACLHDIAYPLEIALKSFNKYSVMLHELRDGEVGSFLKVDPMIYDRLNLLPILLPNSDIGIVKRDTALGLIADCISRARRAWVSPLSYETLLGLLNRFLSTNLLSGRIDHGVFSAFVLLNRTYQLYQKHITNWDIKDYYFEIVDSAAAIFLHNAYMHSDLRQIFGDGKYRYDNPSALGFLLYLCDSVCEWLRGRQSDSNQYGFFVGSDGTLFFKVPKNAANKMKKTIAKIDDRVKIVATTSWSN